MKVIDARSGQEMKVGTAVDYGDGESVTMLEVKPGWFSASARIRRLDAASVVWNPVTNGFDSVTNEFWTPLQVRWTHPRFFLRRVGFLPS